MQRISSILKGFVAKWGYILVLFAVVLAYIALPKDITIDRSEILIAGGFLLLYIVITDVRTELTNALTEFSTNLFKSLNGIQNNLPTKSNPGKFPPIEIPSSQKKPSQAGESAFLGLIIGGIIGASVGGGAGAVIGGLLGAVLGDTVKRNLGTKRRK